MTPLDAPAPPDPADSPGHYRRALEAAVREYEALGAQRRDLDTRLAQLAQSIGTLTRLIGLTPTVPLGLTDACRLVLRGGLPMTPLDVRDRLLGIGVDLSVYSSDLAVIHTVLKRLNEAGEIRLISRAAGKHAYLWQHPPTAVRLGPEVAQFVRELEESGKKVAASRSPIKPKPKTRTRRRTI
jgi:hypothetical protein